MDWRNWWEGRSGFSGSQHCTPTAQCTDRTRVFRCAASLSSREGIVPTCNFTSLRTNGGQQFRFTSKFGCLRNVEQSFTGIYEYKSLHQCANMPNFVWTFSLWVQLRKHQSFRRRLLHANLQIRPKIIFKSKVTRHGSMKINVFCLNVATEFVKDLSVQYSPIKIQITHHWSICLCLTCFYLVCTIKWEFSEEDSYKCRGQFE